MNVATIGWFWTRAALPALLLPAAAGCGPRVEKAIEADTAARPVPVTVAPIESRPVERTIEISGTLKGWEEVTVGSKTTGRVARVLHDMGDRVRPGESLVELETVDADLAVEQARKRLQADLAMLGISEVPSEGVNPEDIIQRVPSVVQSRVALEKARRDLSRQRALNERGAGSMQDFQDADNAARGAGAALDNALVTARSTLAAALASRVALEVAEQARKDLVIRVPEPSAPPEVAGGGITYAASRRAVSEGQMLRAGDPVFELVVENPLKLWASIPERYGPEVALGQTVRVRVDSRPGESFEGTVARINPAVDPTTRTFPIEAHVPNDRGLLRPGSFAQGEVVTERDDEALVVPIESIVQFAGVTKLFVVEGGADGSRDLARARAVPVEMGLEGAGWVEVLGDLPRGGRVVTTGMTQLADGTPVEVRRPEDALPPPAEVREPARLRPVAAGKATE